MKTATFHPGAVGPLPQWTKLPTPDEERELAHRRDRGDGAARDALIERCIPLAIRLAMGYARRCPDRADDMIGRAMVALCLAADAFDPDKGYRFGKTLELTIRAELYRESLEQSYPVRINVRAHQRLGSAVFPKVTDLGDLLENQGDQVEPLDPGLLDLPGLLDQLPDRLATSLRLRFGIGGDCLTTSEIASRFGVATNTVRVWQREALARLRSLFSGGEA